MEDPIKRMKRQATDWEIISHKGIILRIDSELSNSTVEKQTLQLENGPKT